MTDDLPGPDRRRARSWLGDHLDATPPLSFELVAAGGSNLTFRVGDADGRSWALRRPPEGRTLATAHDVGREWQILTALHGGGAPVPVPRPVLRCEDAEVIGAPFFLMEFVDGPILRDEGDATALGPARAERAAETLITVLAALHDVDVAAVGLDGLGPRTGYVERQLHRWRTQVEQAGIRDLPAIGDLHRRLAATIPAEGPRPSLVHGDYRFDNVVLDADGAVAAVLDWELGTIGDPVADVCWSLLYWADPGDDAAVLPSSPTLAGTVPDRAWAGERYEAVSGRRLDALPWFTAFGWWKMACIVEGVHGRRRSGARGGSPPAGIDASAARVDHLLEIAGQAAARAGI